MKTTDAAAPGLQLLSRASLQKKPELSFTDVPCPELGGIVRVQALTAEQRDSFMESVLDAQNKVVNRGFAQKHLSLAVVDEDGKPAVSLQTVQSWPAFVVDRLFKAADKLSGITDPKIEEQMGKSELGPTDASSSAGPGA